MTNRRQYDYTIGDRVAERPKAHGLLTKYADVKERLQQYRSQRYGTVVGINIKPNKSGAKLKFLLIRWDHLKTPTEHAQMRICPADQLQRLQSEGYGFEVE